MSRGEGEPLDPLGVQIGMSLPDLAPEELYRYARHLVLPEVGPEGQRRLKAARVLCVGAGGLGSPLALYLAAAGVGTLGLVDFDVVDASNLQRQLLHGTGDVGRSKLDSAADRLADVNPHVTVVKHPVRLDSENALDIIADYDVVVDGTDNFPTRYLVNDACVLSGKPNVYGSIFRWEGQVSLFATPGGPCYRCLFREPPPPGLVPNCAEGGVMGVLPGIVGSLQAMETIKLLLGVGDSLAGRLLMFDALAMTWREIEIRRNPECPVCGDSPTQRELIDYEVFCGVASEAPSPQPEVSAMSDSSASPEAPTPPRRGEVGDLTPNDLSAMLESGEPPFLLDVREPWEWGVSSLERYGAVLIPMGSLQERVAEIPVDRPVVVYCRSGNRSLMAAQFLAYSGVAEVYNLSGGMQVWARDVQPGLPVA